jgi:aromatic-L-amino-acid decarboxylase
MRALGEAVLGFVNDFVAQRAHAPAHALDHEVPPDPTESQGTAGTGTADIDALLDHIGHAALKAVDPAGPGYLAYIPGGGLYTAALADFVTAAVNRYVGVAPLAPALVELETAVVRWIADLFDFPTEARGILTTGGSLANFSAVVTARHALLGEGWATEKADATIYVSDQAHHSIAKAAVLAGFPTTAIRIIPTDDDMRIDLDALEQAIERDKRPFLLVGSAGTTNTGAIDDLGALAELARTHDLWFHVDAAYGGFFQLTERGRQRLRGIERADSITLDPHKGMFLPYGTGCLLVRDGIQLKRAHHVGAEYLQDLGDTGVPSFAEHSPELSRELRGLRIWLPIRLHGQAAFTEALDEKLDLARHAYERLAEIDDVAGIELPWEPELSVVAFHLPDGERVLREVNASRRVFLSSTTIRGRFTLRIAVLSHRTHRDRVDEAVDLIEKAIREP